MSRRFQLFQGLALAAFVFAATAAATDIPPTFAASIHDAPIDGNGDSFNASPFEGLMRRISPSQEDRAIQEFDVQTFAGSTIQAATLSGAVFSNNSFDVGVRTFDFMLYAGNGVADLADHQIAAAVVGSASYHPPMQTNFNYTFNVTAAVQALVSGGAGWIGLRVVCTTDPNFPNILDDASSRLSITVAPTPGAPFCAGDGSGTSCPCGNDSAAGANEGCLNSLILGGKLVASGQASVAADSLVLAGTNMPNASALYFQGTSQQSGGAGALFGDGLRCAAGTIIRLGTKTNAGGASSYPEAGDASISVRGVLPPTGGARSYQVWYRNAAAFCTSATFNLTNGWLVTWTP